MKTILTLMLTLSYLTICSQPTSKYALSLDVGYTFNGNISLNDAPIENSVGTFVGLTATRRLLSFSHFHTEIGLGLKTIYVVGSIRDVDFDATTLRIGLPVHFVFHLTEKWSAAAGFFFQNNVDIDEFDLRLRDKYSWRVNGIPEIRYALNTKWQVNLKGHFNLRKLPDPYLVNDPNNAFSFGLSRSL